MQSLRELQRRFGRSLLESGGPVAMPPGFKIYVGNVYGNWSKALASAYPIVRKIVGGDFFDGLSRAYARAHPSESGDLNEFGKHFAAFVARSPHTQDLPYLPDTARMEWFAHCAHFAADAQRFDPARLAGIPPEQYSSLRLQCGAPGNALIASIWPLARIWEVHQDRYRGAPDVDVEPAPGRFLVFRAGWHINVESITPGDYRFLAEANRGAALGEALEAACAADPLFDAASALSRWVGKGVVRL
jgi:hypothetical protein